MDLNELHKHYLVGDIGKVAGYHWEVPPPTLRQRFNSIMWRLRHPIRWWRLHHPRDLGLGKYELPDIWMD